MDFRRATVVTGVPLHDLVNRASLVLRNEPAGLATDIDGTISHLAPTPGEARIEREAIRSLELLADQIDYVGVITGRQSASAREMTGSKRLHVIGNHGLEGEDDRGKWIHPAASTSRGAVSAALTDFGLATARAPWMEGVLLEDKGISASIHYRLSQQPEETAAEIRVLLAEIALRHNLRVTEGKMVVELRPGAIVNKGTALADLAQQRGLAALVFIGDDQTDADGFRALTALRRDGLETLSIAIASPETPQEVLDAADGILQGVNQCSDFLALLAATPGTGQATGEVTETDQAGA